MSPPPVAEAGNSGRDINPYRISPYVRAFVETTTDCVYFLDGEWRFTFCNQRAAEELRIRQECTGANLWQAFPQLLGTIFENRFRQAVVERSVQAFEAYFQPLSSWYEVHAVPVADGLMVIFRNINARRTAAEALRTRERQLATVFGQTMMGILHRDFDCNVLMVNDRFCEIVGRSREELNGLPMKAFTYADDYEWNRSLYDKHIETGEPFQFEKRYVRPDGELIWCAVNVSFVRDDSGRIVSTITVAEDIHARKKAEEKAHESQRQLATLIDNLPGIVYRCSVAAPWPFSFLSEGAEALTGYTTEDFLEQRITWATIIHEDDLERVEEDVRRGVEERRLFSVEYRIVTRSGEVRWVIDRGQCVFDSFKQAAFLEGIISDITTQKQAEERITWVAHHDALTRLPNRALFQERLEKALIQSENTGRKVGLLLLDVDHLKEINDTLGHDAGDFVLQTVADRLSVSVRDIDTVARNGGDEFAIILPDVADEQEIDAILKPVLDRLKKPFAFAGRLLDCRASIGVSIWPDHAQEGASLLKQADIALYMAKSTGRGKVMLFEPSMRTETQRRNQMRSNARMAIDECRIEPFYQPKVHLRSGEIAGFEALLRWHHSHAGIQAPSSIQAAFDDPHLSVALAQQMHNLVFKHMRRWLDSGIPFGHVAINVSAAEFRGAAFADRILERLHAGRIPTHCLELEVTETVFLGQGAECVGKALNILSAEGIKIALDDFGTGYASLSHLKQFPVDIIKIDRSFVQDVGENPEDTAILQAVLNLGKNLGIATVAEGVETAVQEAFLRLHGCDLGQGYRFGQAVPSSRIPALVSSWESGWDHSLARQAAGLKSSA